MPAPKSNRNARKGTRNMTARLVVRCTAKELREWKASAKNNGITLAEFVRYRLW